jgi:hypothetical protein
LVGDLVVASVELAEAPPPADFERCYARIERWLRLAALAGNAARGEKLPILLTHLADAIGPLLRPLRTACEGYGRDTDWEKACVFRSALEAMRDLLGVRYADELDTSRIETAMLRFGPKSFRRLAVPEGTPPHHWWWYGGVPASERSLQMNERMRQLLGFASDDVPLAFRRRVANGFILIDRCLFLRDVAPTGLAPDESPTQLECTFNELRVEDHMERDPSRRPVDLAAAAVACARHLVAELRRRPYGKCRVIVTMRQFTSSIRFHQIRDGEAWLDKPLDHYDDPVLTLDTA